MKKIEVEIPEGKEAKWVGNVLTLVDEQPKSIMDRVKSYEDACKELGIEPVSDHSYSTHFLALVKLETIVEALNEGWIANEHMDEKWWYPWFYRFNKSNESEYKDYVFVCSNFSSNPDSGVAFVDVAYVTSHTYSHCGSRLALKSKELAVYCGKQFIQLWCDYLLG